MVINDVLFNVELQDIITELQAQLQINNIQLLQKTRETPKDIMVQCPYHSNGQERKPSAGISKDTGTFHCFACGETHSLCEVISHCFGHYDDVLGTFGWKWLNRNFLTVAVEERKDVEIHLERNNISRKGDILGSGDNNQHNWVTEEELDSYRYIHPYMYERKLTDEIIELFDIGYDKNTQCITFPVRDIDGHTLFIARRSVKTKFFNYPQGAEKPLYGLYELYQQEKFPEELIICESMLDALVAWVYGKPAAALNGLGNGLQFEQLRKLPCRKLILATDMDERGLAARDRIKKNIRNKIITEYIWNKDEAKDLNDMTEQQFLNLEEVF